MLLKVERLWGALTAVLHANVCVSAAAITSETRRFAFIVDSSHVEFAVVAAFESAMRRERAN
jgi:hypothetical protein